MGKIVGRNEKCPRRRAFEEREGRSGSLLVFSAVASSWRTSWRLLLGGLLLGLLAVFLALASVLAAEAAQRARPGCAWANTAAENTVAIRAASSLFIA